MIRAEDRNRNRQEETEKIFKKNIIGTVFLYLIYCGFLASFKIILFLLVFLIGLITILLCFLVILFLMLYDFYKPQIYFGIVLMLIIVDLYFYRQNRLRIYVRRELAPFVPNIQEYI
jgi:hypothetical protein